MNYKNFILAFFTSAAIVSVPATSYAARPSYDYLQATYLRQDLDDFDCTQTGLELAGSISVDESMFVQASMNDVSDAPCGSQLFRVSAGLRGDYGTQSNLFMKASLFNLNIDTPDDSGLGYGIAAGVRSYINSGVELNGTITYDNVDIDGVDLGLGFGVGIVYGLSNGLAVTGDLTYAEENDVMGTNIGIRYYF